MRNLRPLMIKAHLEDDFDALISSVERIYPNHAQVAQFYENIASRLETQYQGQSDSLLQRASHIIDRGTRLEENADLLVKVLQNRISSSLKNPIITDFQLNWPQGFPEIKTIEKKIKNILSRFLSRPGSSIERFKKTSKIALHVPLEGTTVYTLPVKVDFYLEGAISQRRIIIKTKEVIGSGGQRKVLRAFDLLSGEELASKPFCSSIEKMVIQSIHQEQLPGFVPLVTLRGTTRFYEKRCETLSPYFYADIKTRYKLICQMLSALKNLHRCFIGTINYSYPNTTEEKTFHRVPIYHGDIKPENFLIFTDAQGGLQSALSDLGTVCDIIGINYTPFFRSPEKTRFIEEKMYIHRTPNSSFEREDLVQHNLKYGQSNDVWCLGILFATLLSGRQILSSDHGVPDLNFLKNSINRMRNQWDYGPTQTRPYPLDYLVKDLSQNEVDDSVDELARTCATSNRFQPVWSIIKLMLKVNPSERISANDALLAINALSL